MIITMKELREDKLLSWKKGWLASSLKELMFELRLEGWLVVNQIQGFGGRWVKNGMRQMDSMHKSLWQYENWFIEEETTAKPM